MGGYGFRLFHINCFYPDVGVRMGVLLGKGI